MRRHNMEEPPRLQLPLHVERRRKRRSTASHGDERWEEAERLLLEAGVRSQWLQIHRVINKRWAGQLHRVVHVHFDLPRGCHIQSYRCLRQCICPLPSPCATPPLQVVSARDSVPGEVA